MRIFLYILVLWSVGFSGSGILCGAAEVVSRGLGDLQEIWLNPKCATKLESVVELDTSSTDATWTRALEAGSGKLKAGTHYTFTVELRRDKDTDSSLPIDITVRDRATMKPEYDLLHRGIRGSEDFVKYKFQFEIPSDGLDSYAVLIHLPKNFKGAMRNFKLTEGYGEEFIPATTDAEKYVGFLPATPTGAKEFEVELPSADGETVDASDFGLSENSQDVPRILNSAIAHCKKMGARRLTVPKGRYYISESDAIVFDGLENFDFDGNGSTFVFFKKSNVNMFVKDCKRIRLKNFNFDWDWAKDPLGSLLKVVGVGRGENGSEFVDFEFYQYEEFPRRDVRIAVVSSYDPKTKSVGVEGGFDRQFEFFKGKNKPKTEWLNGNTLRVFAPNLVGIFKDGMLFRAHHYYYDMMGIRMRDNTHLTLEDVNIYSCVGHGLAVSGTQSYWQFLRVNVKPPKGDKRRVITSTADHCHISSSRGFFKMIDCEFTAGGDDCLNIHDGAGYASKVGANSLLTRNMSYIHDFFVGDEIELRHDDYSPSGYVGKIIDIKTVNKEAKEYEFFFDKAIPDAKRNGFILFNKRYDSRNIILRGCYFHHCKARGMLILARDVTIENCRIVSTGKGVMNIETGYTFNLWSEGYGASNIVVRNNLFESANPRGMAHDGKPHDIYIGVYMKTDPSFERTDFPIFSDILIQGNTFKDSFGLAAFISSAKNVVVSDNVFEAGIPRQKPLYYRSAFWVTNASDIYIINNIYKDSPLIPNAGVFFDAESVKNLTVSGNRIQ